MSENQEREKSPMTQIDEWDVLLLKGMSGVSIMAFRYLTITPF